MSNMVSFEPPEQGKNILSPVFALDEKMERFHKEAKEDHRLAMELIKYSHGELSVKIEDVGSKVNGEAREDTLG